MNAPAGFARTAPARLAAAHLLVAVAAFGVAALMGVLQGLSIADVEFPLRSESLYYMFVTAHGVLMALVFTTFFIMGLGYALTEEFPSDERGFPTATTLRHLGILRPKDIPAIEVELVEVPQPRAAYGIKGVGEIGLVPTSGAVAAALHMADGVWRNTLPMRRIADTDADD